MKAHGARSRAAGGEAWRSSCATRVGGCGGHESGLYVTASRNGLTLQHYSGNSASQEFYGLGDTQNDTGNSNHGLQWLSAATGGVIDINRGNVSLDELSRSSNDGGTYLHWVQ
jgi:hypothetical protein